MKDKEQIIVDGVDVSKCDSYVPFSTYMEFATLDLRQEIVNMAGLENAKGQIVCLSNLHAKQRSARSRERTRKDKKIKEKYIIKHY